MMKIVNLQKYTSWRIRYIGDSLKGFEKGICRRYRRPEKRIFREVKNTNQDGKVIEQ